MIISPQLPKLQTIASPPQTLNLLIKSHQDATASKQLPQLLPSEFIYILASLRLPLNCCVFPVFVCHFANS